MAELRAGCGARPALLFAVKYLFRPPLPCGLVVAGEGEEAAVMAVDTPQFAVARRVHALAASEHDSAPGLHKHLKRAYNGPGRQVGDHNVRRVHEVHPLASLDGVLELRGG